MQNTENLKGFTDIVAQVYPGKEHHKDQKVIEISSGQKVWGFTG